ncbi:MAG: lysophospholipid acyltransferase family protein [Polyangiaceae bacterium]
MIWRGLAWLVARLRYAWLAPLGAVLGWLVGSVLRIRRAHVEDAMRSAGIAPENAGGMYRSLGAGALEFLWLAGRGENAVRFDELVTIDEASREVLVSLREAGAGFVFAATHTGNWDLAACAIAHDLPLLVVTKRLSARGIDAFWQGTRASYGVDLCLARGAIARGRAALEQGGAVAMMIDQVPLARRHGIETEFLGRTAFVDKAPATLAAKAGSPLVVAASRRDENGIHRLSVLEVITPPAHAGRAWIREATVKATQALETHVRNHPSSWLWLHRRWRTPAT